MILWVKSYKKTDNFLRFTTLSKQTLFTISGNEYEGTAATKKEAKARCAKAALAGQYSVEY